MKTIKVPLDWHRIKWMPGQKPAEIVEQLAQHGVDRSELREAVYVIRLNGDICVDYPNGQSPTVYIGQGRLLGRLRMHSRWTSELTDLLGKRQFQIYVVLPKILGEEKVHLDTEAALINYFEERYGATPLWNKQSQRRRNENYEYNNRQLKAALSKRSGKKYKWAIKPMISSEFHRTYNR